MYRSYKMRPKVSDKQAPNASGGNPNAQPGGGQNRSKRTYQYNYNMRGPSRPSGSSNNGGRQTGRSAPGNNQNFNPFASMFGGGNPFGMGGQQGNARQQQGNPRQQQGNAQRNNNQAGWNPMGSQNTNNYWTDPGRESVGQDYWDNPNWDASNPGDNFSSSQNSSQADYTQYSQDWQPPGGGNGAPYGNAGPTGNGRGPMGGQNGGNPFGNMGGMGGMGGLGNMMGGMGANPLMSMLSGLGGMGGGMGGLGNMMGNMGGMGGLGNMMGGMGGMGGNPLMSMLGMMMGGR